MSSNQFKAPDTVYCAYLDPCGQYQHPDCACTCHECQHGQCCHDEGCPEPHSVEE